MPRGPRRRARGDDRVSRVRIGFTTGTALAVGVLAACCLSSAGGFASATLASAATASAPPASPATGANPAEGHSPELTEQLSGPLSGTGETRPAAAAHASTAMQQATASTATTPLNGIDVSSGQHPSGATINWADVAAAGYQFAAIKATEGNYYTNPYYASDAADAIAAGMYVAAYQFANPNPKNGTAVQEADYAVQNAGNYHVGGHYLPLMLDIEYNPYPDDGNECYGLSPAQMVSWVSSFMAEATRLTGAAPIIYTPPAWWDTCAGGSTAFGGDVLWVPAYSSGSPGTLPSGWSNWTMWQYTSSGTVSGISGPVDLDYFSGGPQMEQSPVNTAAALQIETLNALAHQQVTYAATGLPSGLTMSSAGLITGTPTTTGTYQVTVTASPSTVLQATVSFTWDVTSLPLAAGVEGSDGAMFVQAPQLSAGWHSEGGAIAGPPAVAAAPNANGTSPVSPLFVATGTDKHLYIRSLTAGWQEITPVASCLGSPAAVITTASGVSTLTVACEGTNKALYDDTATLAASGLPAFSGGWKDLGGTLTGGPAVAPVGGTTTFFAPGAGGHIYTRTESTGFAESPWVCVGSPAAAVQAATGVTVFACQGTNHALWYATSSGSGWTAAASLGGSMIGGPGIAAASGQLEFFAEGSGDAVWQRTVATSWASLGGSVINGAAAAALE